MPRGRPPKIKTQTQECIEPVVEVIPKRGRPAKYEPWMCDALLKVFASGRFVARFCAEVGIVRSTFYEWIKEYPELNTAYNHAQELSRAFWEEVLVTQATSMEKAPNATQLAMVMNNKFKDEYSRNPNGDSSGGMTIGSITINNLEKLPEADLLKRLNDLYQDPQIVEQLKALELTSDPIKPETN
jgi:hypothetical protein